ncbi:MAG: FAD-dependent oxidoreductase, partial [Ramlibacter sp.]
MNQPADPEPAPAGERSPQSLRWKSHDYAALRRKAQQQVVIDVLVVGSGYGGAMAAWSLAGKRAAQERQLSVCVLERGQEYAPGMFASSLQELPPHVRVHRRGRGKTIGRPEALIDVRIGPDVCAIVGNGLGGTSLINAGVMEPPRWRADQQIPEALRRDLEDPGYLTVIKKALRASDTLSRDHPKLHGELLPKARALKKAADNAGVPFRAAAITVQTEPGDPDAPACTLCGDCMTGCNVGAKRSLDTTLLAQAADAGAEIYTGGTVLKVEPHPEGGWWVHTVFTDAGLRERHCVQKVHARKVILAAGTFGSTEILMHSRGAVALSQDKLGTGFSCNGDNLVAVHGARHTTSSTSDETVPLTERTVGPTITGVIDIPNGPLLEEFSIPAPLKRFFDETVTTTRLLHRLAHWPGRTPGQQRHRLDSMAVDPDAMERTLLVGVVGHDEAQGRIVLPDDSDELEGVAGVDWSAVRDSPMVNAAYLLARKTLRRGAPPEADILPNPAWRPVPDEMASLVKERGPLLTVHPLGGCPMAARAEDGVVNEFGQVFRGTSGTEAYADLVVLDGSILPGSVGANPALTIAGVAFRACRELARQWQWSDAPPPQETPEDLYKRLTLERAPDAIVLLQATPAGRTRPEYRKPEACTPDPGRRTTRVELIERLCGEAGERKQYWLELTLCYRHADLASLTGQATRTVTLDTKSSWLRLYDNADGRARRRLVSLGEAERAQQAIFTAPVAGTLAIGEPGDGPERVLWAMHAAGA